MEAFIGPLVTALLFSPRYTLEEAWPPGRVFTKGLCRLTSPPVSWPSRKLIVYLFHIAPQLGVRRLIYSVPVNRDFDLFIELEDDQGIR